MKPEQKFEEWWGRYPTNSEEKETMKAFLAGYEAASTPEPITDEELDAALVSAKDCCKKCKNDPRKACVCHDQPLG